MKRWLVGFIIIPNEYFLDRIKMTLLAFHALNCTIWNMLFKFYIEYIYRKRRLGTLLLRDSQMCIQINYIVVIECNQCLSPLQLCVWIPFNTQYNILWLATGRWFSPGTPVSSTNKTDRHDIAEILLKVALKTTTVSSNTMSMSIRFLIKEISTQKNLKKMSNTDATKNTRWTRVGKQFLLLIRHPPST